MKNKYASKLCSTNGAAQRSRQEFRLRGADQYQEPQIGSLVGHRYYLLSILGKGGMSVVFKAKDKAKQRILAVKTLRYHWAEDGLAVKRFQREAETLSLLRHPAIVGIHDFGATAAGQPFFVMEYLTGMSLANLLAKWNYLPVKRVRAIFGQVFDALHHAHKQGLVHRDMKPGNIMLVGRGEHGDTVKIVDFGIAKLQQEAQHLTRLGEVWGSPVYMSPEQCRGASLDKRSDIYSLGICVFEALTGQLPFYGRNYFETMSMQINQPAPGIRQIRPDLLFNSELENVLLKALNKDPDKRFQTVSAMKDELEEAVDLLLPSAGNKANLEVRVRMPRLAVKTPPSTGIAAGSPETLARSTYGKLGDGNLDKPSQSSLKDDVPALSVNKLIKPYAPSQPSSFSESDSEHPDNSAVLKSNVVVILFVVLAALSALGYLYVLTQLGGDEQINQVTPDVERAVVPGKRKYLHQR